MASRSEAMWKCATSCGHVVAGDTVAALENGSPRRLILVRLEPTTRVPSDVIALIMFGSRIRPRVARAAVFGDGIGRRPSPMRLV
jgi:hypothetical protein